MYHRLFRLLVSMLIPSYLEIIAVVVNVVLVVVVVAVVAVR
jgi:hypothetical protein